MKRLFATIASIVLGAAIAMAQDFNVAAETFNQGAQAESKTEKLELFRSALEQFSACEDAEAADMVEQCKVAISETLISLGKENINDGLYDEAVKYLKEAAEVAAGYGLQEQVAEANKLIPNALMRKGSTLIKDKNFAEAVAVLQNVVELEPEDGKAWLLLGQSMVKNGQFEEAVDVLTNAASFGQEAKANKLLSTVFIKLGDNKKKEKKNGEAIAFYEKALELSNNAQIAMKIANTYLQVGNSEKAIEYFKQYLAASPDAANAPDVIYTIAATAQKAGDKATAIEYYNMLKDNAKYGATAAQMLGQLK